MQKALKSPVKWRIEGYFLQLKFRRVFSIIYADKCANLDALRARAYMYVSDTDQDARRDMVYYDIGRIKKAKG